MEKTKLSIISQIKNHFNDAREKNYPYNRVDFSVRKEIVPQVLLYLKDVMGFKHLSHISCVDWLEDNEFELVFIVWSPADKIKVFVHTRLDREHPVMDNLDMIWRHAHTYEREMREMFGIQFTGLDAPEEFLLEDWQGPPPMRRDFDTETYAAETYWERPGREDAQDVRETIEKRTGEVLPDFAKNYKR